MKSIMNGLVGVEINERGPLPHIQTGKTRQRCYLLFPLQAPLTEIRSAFQFPALVETREMYQEQTCLWRSAQCRGK